MPEKLKATDLQSILVKVLDQRVAIGGAKRKTMSKREAILRVLLEKAAEGHVAAMDVFSTASSSTEHRGARPMIELASPS